MFLFEQVFASKFRVQLYGATAPQIGVIFIGKTLDMQRAIYGGHSPITLSRDTINRPSMSERGQWLGTSIIRTGFSTSFAWEHLTADWYREFFDPFVEHARSKPYFIAWRPSTFPAEVGYVHSSGDIKPANMGIRDFMSVTVNTEGLGNE
jgi:hypothetical protein